MGYKAKTVFRGVFRVKDICSKCGMINAPKGALYICAYCGLRINRQLNAAINLYLQIEGLPPSQKLFQELMKG